MAAKPFDIDAATAELIQIGSKEKAGISDDEIRQAISIMPKYFRALLARDGHDERESRALTTKFRDAGRRSAPWKAFSSRVAGRPQDGSDGNRISRWLLPLDHKQYATEADASLVEISFYLQALSFKDAPKIQDPEFSRAWGWLTTHEIIPGAYVDPIQVREISMSKVLKTPRMMTSGHIVPLDRGGKHQVGNVFLVLHRSNQMQGNMTLDEFLWLSETIVEKHKLSGSFPNRSSRVQMEEIDLFDSPHGG